MEEIEIQIRRVHRKEDALPLPDYMTEGSAGMDLYADLDEDVVLASLERALIPTGIAVALPREFEAQIRPRSGLALSQGLTLVNSPGTIDADYRGEIQIIAINLGKEPVVIRRGQRLAQMVLQRICRARWQEVRVLPSSARQEGGFGHTDKKSERVRSEQLRGGRLGVLTAHCPLTTDCRGGLFTANCLLFTDNWFGMIERYSRPEMAKIWSEENRFQKWLEVEILAAEARARLGEVPGKAVARIKRRARFNTGRIRKIEREVRHEMIAFLRCLAESLGDDSRFIHVGLTSSDVMDTGLALQLKEASSLLADDLRQLMKVLRRQAFKYKGTPMIGRTHGVHAEPITFGLKLALWYEEVRRNLVRFERAADEVSFGKISGAVGTFAQVSPKVEAYVCKKSGLKPAPVSNQIVQRDRHAFFFATLAVIASSLEKFAVEIRHLQRTEVMEAEEPFARGQMGSSAMPHKRNPILSENISGLARLIRSYAMAAFENVPLWHERDISHSSVERVIAPDATVLLDFMLVRLTHIIGNLCVYPQTMRRNLERSGGVIFSEKVLLRLVEKGLSRDAAYRIVQRHALEERRDDGDLKRALGRDPQMRRYLSSSELEEIWDLDRYLENVEVIFRRVFH